VQLAWSTGYDNPTAWAELVNKIKDGLLSAFDSAVVQREEEVKRSESQRQMPGWNFCTFFILKVSQVMYSQHYTASRLLIGKPSEFI
jgi:hypothetical protein